MVYDSSKLLTTTDAVGVLQTKQPDLTPDQYPYKKFESLTTPRSRLSVTRDVTRSVLPVKGNHRFYP